MKQHNKSIIPAGKIEQRILMIRGEKIIIDADLAEFYGVPTKRLNEQVKRNKDRFPEDFMFQLNADEKSEVVAKCDHLEKLKFSKVLPYAFTEHGAIMAASVLNSPQAAEISIFIVRAFVKLRQAISEHKELSRKISQIERHLSGHDEQINAIIKTIKQLIQPAPVPKKRRIGFDTEKH
jgi:DNA gyrase/topoisomerase IV subunit A